MLLGGCWSCAAAEGEAGRQFPRGLSPRRALGETETRGKSLQAAALCPLPSAQSPAELARRRRRRRAPALAGGPGPRTPAAPPAPSILPPLRLRPTPLPGTRRPVTVSARALRQGSPAGTPAPGGTRPAGTPPAQDPGAALLPGGRSHVPRPGRGSCGGAPGQPGGPGCRASSTQWVAPGQAASAARSPGSPPRCGHTRCYF